MRNLSCRPGSEVDTCRACGGATAMAFEATILGRYSVNFLKCQVCKSLQPQRPFWIAESYTVAIAATDTGADGSQSAVSCGRVCRGRTLPGARQVSRFRRGWALCQPGPRDSMRATRRAAIGTTE
jgi:hypothetical protein